MSPTAAPTVTTPLPTHCDVLVVGAGPAGSACAQTLARAGLQVVLADQHRFPRDKVCGDALIPDAYAALQRLGVLDEVLAQAQAVQQVRCIGPSGRHLDVPGHMAVLPRRQLDDLLCRAAQRAGARLLSPARFEAPLLQDEQVVGARLRCEAADGSACAHEIRARWVVLATGAVPQALAAVGLSERQTPSGVALRGYFRHEPLRAHITQLQLVWHPRLRGGYGWIFPGPDGLFNLGVGLTDSHHQDEDGKGHKHHGAQGGNLRRMLQAFGEIHAPAGELLSRATPVGEMKGAPLRCGLRGARWSRPGLLVTGEAAGSTYAFSGEGIGKALETGLLAAEALLHHPGATQAGTAGAAALDSRADNAVRAHYEASLRALQPRFDVYQTANHVNHRPWLADIVIWRARRSPRILAKVQGVLNETHTPRLFTVRGIFRLLFQ